MDNIKFYLAKLLYFFKVIDLPSAIVSMLPQKDKQLIEEKIKSLDNQINNDDFALIGDKKRKIVVEYLLDKWLNKLEYEWLNLFFDTLPEGYRKYLANAIVEIIFFNLKKLDN